MDQEYKRRAWRVVGRAARGPTRAAVAAAGIALARPPRPRRGPTTWSSSTCTRSSH